MKDYLYYLFDEKLSGTELSEVKEKLCELGAKVIDLTPSKKTINKRLKELKGPKKYALMIGNNVEAQQAAKEASVHFCGWLNGSTDATAFQALPFRQLLKDIRLLPLLSQPYPYHNYGWLGNTVKKYTRWVHFKQIKGLSHKPKHSSEEYVCARTAERDMRATSALLADRHTRLHASTSKICSRTFCRKPLTSNMALCVTFWSYSGDLAIWCETT